MMDRAELAERYGYTSGRCPKCGRRAWSDTGVFECEHCGYTDAEPEEEEEQ